MNQRPLPLVGLPHPLKRSSGILATANVRDSKHAIPTTVNLARTGIYRVSETR